MLRGGRRGDLPGGRHRSGEADPADVRVGDQRGAGLGAEPLHDVEDAGRQARPRAAMSASSDAVSGAHSGGLSDDGVAGRERRTDPPGREHQRRVPRA